MKGSFAHPPQRAYLMHGYDQPRVLSKALSCLPTCSFKMPDVDETLSGGVQGTVHTGCTTCTFCSGLASLNNLACPLQALQHCLAPVRPFCPSQMTSATCKYLGSSAKPLAQSVAGLTRRLTGRMM